MSKPILQPKPVDMKPYSITFLLFAFFSMILSTGAMAQCEIGEIEATPMPCDSMGYFDMVINFEYANTGSQGFSVQGGGVTYGTFEYSDLPIIIYDLIGDGTTYYEFVVIDLEYPDCNNFIDFGTFDCNGGDCLIWNVDVFPQECDSGYFNVTLGFWHENVGAQGFRVQGNGNNYGNFEYANLPITIGPLAGDGVTIYEFVVIDNEFGECTDWAAIDPVDCQGGGDCEIGELVIDDHPCDSGMYYVYFDFEYANVSDSGFALYINYDLYGYYLYEQLPIENLGPFVGDGTTVYHFLVRDVETYECAEDANFGPIDCGGSGGCEIGELDVTILPCNDNDEFFVLLDFDYANTGDVFTVQGNGMMYGSFMYADLPVEIGPLMGDGVTMYEFAVIDSLYNDCAEDTYIGSVSCDSITEFMNFTTHVASCEGATYHLELNFDVVNGGSQGFMVMGNDEIYGSYDYSQLPVSIGPLLTDGTTPYHFIAKDKEQPAYGNWDKLVPFTCTSLGIEDHEHHEIVKVYPNPSYGSITFENLKQGNITAMVYNSSGSEIKTFSFSGTYKIKDLNAGMYYYRIMDNNGSVSSGKIIVTK